MGISPIVLWMHEIVLQVNLLRALFGKGSIKSLQFGPHADRHVISPFLVIEAENTESADVDSVRLHGKYAAKKQRMVVVSIQDKNRTGKRI
tara:strand:- start:194 stop:466 length:273 start_codon:yes stop_codon:yes gene_type:complete